MRHIRPICCALAAVFAAARGQPVISAKAGLVTWAEGRVLIGGEPVHRTPISLAGIREDLRTGEGRAELLLTPSAFLRLDEQSGVSLTSENVATPGVEVLAGSVVLEYWNSSGGTSVVLTFGNAMVTVRDSGVYSLDTAARSLRVYSGRAVVVRTGIGTTVESGRRIELAGSRQADRFDLQAADDFLRWAAFRSEYVGMSNCFSAARARYRMGDDAAGFCKWSYISPYGAACLPGNREDYCRRFLGPLNDLER